MGNPPAAIMPGIDHVIVLMLENRSFDTTVGWLYEQRQPAHRIPDVPFRYEGLYAADLAGYANPLSMPGYPTLYYPPRKGATTSRNSGATYLDSPPIDPNEEMQYVTDQIYGPLRQSPPPINPPADARPAMKGFLQDYANLWAPADQAKNLPAILKVMETYRPDQLPVLNDMAAAFAISDAWFSSAPTQTNPNRAFLACGTSLGQINNQGTWAYGDFDAPTIWNRLHDLRVTWKIFWEETFVPVKDSDNKGWTRKAFPRLEDIATDDDFLNMAEFHRLARAGRLPAFSFIEPSWTLEEKEFGKVRGLQGDDYHPPGDVRPGEDLLAQIYTSLLANHEAFQRTLLIITFDEHGGTFDHVAPPVAVPPDDRDQEGFAFARYGVRVPTLFVSPMVKPYTLIRAGLPHEWPPFDHTSIAATVLRWQGLTREQFGLGARTAQAPTFEHVLNAGTPRSRDELVIGPPRQPPGPPPIDLGDPVILTYLSPGKYHGWKVGAATSSEDYWWPTLTTGKGVPLRFTLGDSRVAVPAETLTHGSFLYVRGGDSQLGSTPYWALWDRDDDSRTDVWYSADSKPTVPAPQLYWMIKHADTALAVIGQRIYDGDIVTLQLRPIPSFGNWLPGLLVPAPGSFATYLSVTTDPDYERVDVGRWRITRA